MSGIIASNISSNSGIIKAPSAGVWVKISAVTASASATVSFTSGLDGTYDKYCFLFNDIHPSSDSNQFRVNFSDDGGSSYAVSKQTSVWRAFQNESGSSGSGYVASNDLNNGTGVQILASSLGGDNDHPSQGYLYLYAPSDTTFVTHFLSNITTTTSDDQIMDFHVGGYCNTTSAINAAQFSMTSNNIDAGTITLYGIN